MILSDREILRYIDKGDLIIEPFSEASLQPSGYDLRFSGECILDGERLEEETIELPPKKHGILSTVEKVGLTNLVGDLKLRSSFCREGIVGSFGWVDAGWIGVLSLSVMNSGETPVTIERGERVAQIVFVTLSSGVVREYDGKYKGSESAEASKREEKR